MAAAAPVDPAESLRALMAALSGQQAGIGIGNVNASRTYRFGASATHEQLNAQEDNWDDLTLDKVVSVLSAEDRFNLFREMIDLFEYNGFNPQEFIVILRKLAQMAGITKDEFYGDMVALIAYYIKRGTSINRRGVANSSSDKASKLIQLLGDRYRIVDSVAAIGDRGGNNVSIARIANTFPEIVSEQMIRNRVPPLGDKGIIPTATQFSAGASLIPTHKAFDPFFELWLQWSVTFDKQINRLIRQQSNKKPTDEEILANSRMYASIARTQGRLTDKARLEHLNKFAFEWKFNATVLPTGGLSLPEGAPLFTIRSAEEAEAELAKIPATVSAGGGPGKAPITALVDRVGITNANVIDKYTDLLNKFGGALKVAKPTNVPDFDTLSTHQYIQLALDNLGAADLLKVVNTAISMRGGYTEANFLASLSKALKTKLGL